MDKTVPLTASRSNPKFSVWRLYCRRYYPARSSSNMPWLDQWISKLSRQNNRDTPHYHPSRKKWVHRMLWSYPQNSDIVWLNHRFDSERHPFPIVGPIMKPSIPKIIPLDFLLCITTRRHHDISSIFKTADIGEFRSMQG